jgi:hypothetical protein
MSTTTRRHVLRLGLVGTVTLASSAVASGPFALSILAGPPSPPQLLGVQRGKIPPGSAPNAVPLAVLSMDLATGRVQTIPVAQFLQDGTTPVFSVNETFTAWTALADGSLLVAITPVTANKDGSQTTRLARLRPADAKAMPSRGLNRQEQLSGLVVTGAGTLLGLAYKRNGTPSARLVTIDPQTSAVAEYAQVHVPTDRRFTTLAQCPDGRLYSTGVGNAGDTYLVQLDTGKSQLVTLNGEVWNSCFASVTCTPDNQLLALGAPRYKTPNAVYRLDATSGALSPVRDFDVARLTVAQV